MNIKVAISSMAVAVSLGIATLPMSGCSAEHNTAGATIAGAAAGGLLGAAAFSGSTAWLGILGGALVGGIVGNQIGQYMDRQDAARAHAAYVSQSGKGQWTNHETGYTYTIKPVKSYQKNGRYCREYQTKATIGGRSRKVYGTACRQPDGSWKVVS